MSNDLWLFIKTTPSTIKSGQAGKKKGGEKKRMKKLSYKKLAASVSSAALLMNMFSGVAFATVSCTISGNTNDDNTCDFASLRSVSVDQSNDMDVDNDVDVEANTGDNEAEKNAGGEIDIETGDVTADVTVDTSGNTNSADVAGVSTNQDYEFEIDGNTNDDNKIKVDTISEVEVDQDNDADVDNDVDVEAETGGNEAEKNAGGDVTIETGDVEVNEGVMITTAVNSNVAMVGASDTGATLSAKIVGNTNEDNLIDLALLSEITLDQDNDADVDNDVEVEAETGDNEAEQNAGGGNSIETGDVTVDVTLDTMANFNSADVADSYLGDVELKIAENTNDDNDVELDLIDELEVGQDNDQDTDNDVEVEAETGDNESEKNAAGGDDPAIDTGDVDSSTSVTSSGNVNVFGESVELEFDWDLSELTALLNALSNLFD